MEDPEVSKDIFRFEEQTPEGVRSTRELGGTGVIYYLLKRPDRSEGGTLGSTLSEDRISCEIGDPGHGPSHLQVIQTP